MSRKHHHIVSEGYQRFFANADGIRLIDKVTTTAKVVGTKSAFARKHFSSYLKDGAWSDELEDQWWTNENLAFPHVRRLLDGAHDVDGRNSLKVVAALHYARSYQFDILIGRIILGEREAAPQRIARQEDTRAAFAKQYGRPPQAGEVEALVAKQWEEHFAARTFVVSEMANAFNRTMDILAPHFVQLVWPQTKSKFEFVFADNPLIHSGSDGRVTALEGLALGDADQVYLPVGPRLAVPGHQVGDRRLIGGRPPRALCRRRVL